MEKVSFKGTVELIHKSADGEIKKQETIDNLIVNVGKEQIARRLIDVSKSPIGGIHLGTGSTAPTATDTALVTQTHAEVATVIYEADFKVLATRMFTFAGDFILAEAGLFSSAVTPEMYSRILINYSVLINDTLTVNWRIQVV